MGARAGFWIRVVAAAIDVVALFAFLLAYDAVFEAVWYRTYDEAKASALASITFFLAWLVYTSTDVWFAGTPGKLAVGLRITRMDGSPADRWRLFLRWQTKQYPSICALLFNASGLTVFYAAGGFTNLVVLTGCLFALNDDRLTWHDQWAATAVSWRRRKAARGAAPPPLPAV